MLNGTKQFCTRLEQYLIPIGQAGGHFLWPGRCCICKKSILPDDEDFCGACWQALSMALSADYCRRCGRDVSPYGIVLGRCGHCQDLQFEHERTVRVGCYESTLRSMILNLKFSEKTEWAKPLAAMLCQAVIAANLAQSIDILVPVPLHWRRRISRGFNQSHLLTQKLKLPGIPISTDLVRIRHTQQQWDLNSAQRQRNVKDAFAVRRDHQFEGKTIALVDDITTSGATIAECSKTLIDAGAVKVIALVIATADHDD